MYVVGENPLLSEPDLHHATKAIAQLDCLVVQDLFMHETAEQAHVFLPAAAFAEKEGTFTNSERRVQRVRTAVPPPGARRARTGGSPPSWPSAWPGASASTSTASSTTPARPRSSTRWRASSRSSAASPTRGSIARAGCSGRVRPRTTRARPTSTPSRFRAATAASSPRCRPRPPPSCPIPDYPFVLNTGRLLYHWHGGTITRRVEGLLELAPRLEVAIHPADARRLGVETGDRSA